MWVFLMGSWRHFRLPYCACRFVFLAVHVGCEWRTACVVSGTCHVVALSAPLLDADSICFAVRDATAF